MNGPILRILTCLPLALATPALCGCGDDSNSRNAIVQGNVTIDGELAKRGSVAFYPKSGGPAATGQILADGSFSLHIGQGNVNDPDSSTIFSGEYVATVVVNDPADKTQTISEGGPPIAGPRLTAIKYARKETSGLVFLVKPGRNVFPLELEGAASSPAADMTADEVDEEVEVEKTDDEAESVPPAQDTDQPTERTTKQEAETPSDQKDDLGKADKDALREESAVTDGEGVSK